MEQVTEIAQMNELFGAPSPEDVNRLLQRLQMTMIVRKQADTIWQGNQ